MYLEYYGLKEKPFSLTPDPSFLYYSNAHRRAIAFLRYGLQESKGFLQLTGPVGSGKTTLLRAVLSQLDERTRTAYIINPCASFPELLRAVMKDLEVPHIPPTMSKMELLDFFHDYLLAQVRRSNSVIIIFDESQNLSLTNLEEIRMLSNFETSKEKLLQIVFVGQPELVQTLDLPELRQLKQRIQVRYHLTPLRLAEVREYIDHRLAVAGSDGKISFTDSACSQIFAFSGGIPRLINAICDIILLIGYVTEKHAFGNEAVEEAVKELEGRFDEGQLCIEEPEEAQKEPPEEKVEEKPPAPPPVLYSPSPPETVAQQASPQALQSAEKRKPAASTTVKAPDNGGDNHHSAELSNTVIGGLRRNYSASPSRAQGCAEEAIPPDAPPPDYQPQPTPLNSFLRHRTTRKFKAAASGILRLEGQGGVAARLKRFFRKHSNGRNGATSPAGPLSPPEKLSVPDFENPGQQCSAAAVAASESAAINQTAERRRTAPCSKKVIICLKNGGLSQGTVSAIALESEEIAYVPSTKRESALKISIPFADIAAVHFVNAFEEDIPRGRPAGSAHPRGREIIVALVNGDVVRGITLHSRSPESPRFYVICSNDEQQHWTLIEKTGTIGILSEEIQEGIYAEEFETLLFDGLISIADSHLVSPPELSADKLFSLQQYAAASLEYQEALKLFPDLKRVAMKLSLCRLNLGIQHLRANQYLQAKYALERVNANPNIFTRALRLARLCDLLINNSRESAIEKTNESPAFFRKEHYVQD